MSQPPPHPDPNTPPQDIAPSPADRLAFPRNTPIRCISIDVEEYFQIEAAHDTVGPQHWDDWPSRVERNMDLLLDLFSRTRCRATFFFLGNIAQQHPQLARRCTDLGHEVATHGSMHDRLHRLNAQSMLNDVRDSKQRLEDQTGRPVLGYRAPTWSVTTQTSWAVDVLAEAGLRYDASVFPVRHPLYGVPDAPDRPYFIRASPTGARMLELPPLTWRIAGRNLPVAGGGYFRLLPLALMKHGLRQAANQQRPAILYFHPWEFDPDMPRMPLGATGRLRTYTGLRHAADKLEKIIHEFGSESHSERDATAPTAPPCSTATTNTTTVAPRGSGGFTPNTNQLANSWRPIADHLNDLEEDAQHTGVFTLQRQAAA